MSQLLLCLVLITAHLSLTPTISDPDEFIIFTWNGTLYANSVQTGAVTSLGAGGVEEVGYDVYSVEAAPIEPAFDGYGFHHGVWSTDRTRFAYLEIAPPHYRVRMQTTAGDTQLLLEDQLSAARGYLDPAAWTREGELVLVERRLLNHLQTANVWRIDPVTLTLNYDALVSLDRLSGRSALLPDGVTVFLGYQMAQQVGYLFDITSGQARLFPVQLGLPEGHGFEYHPLQVLGAVQADGLPSQLQTIPAIQPLPFLHWPLPDEARSVTCYPDSTWTTANFEVTCPGLSSPRNYVGHEGTDIGGKPDGLPLGTAVYPSAPGVVMATYRECLNDNPSCNYAYGNTVTLEHILIVNGQTQVWYTGYGHLQTVLVEDSAYLDDITEPLALSGATGDGGAHLHFEVRNSDDWVNPWDNQAGHSLWLGSNIHPEATVGLDTDELMPDVLAVCTSFAGNNIRSGPGTTYGVVGKTVEDSTYSVVKITYVDSGEALGDWYHVLFEGGNGWLWSGLLNCP